MGMMTINPPVDFSLPRDYCSYGYFLLTPNHWAPGERAVYRAMGLPGGAALVRVTQTAGRGAGANGDVRKLAGRDLKVTADRSLSKEDRAELRAQLSRMLRLDESAEHIRDFHAKDKRWKKSGRGRLMRSPTLFEDVIKTVTSCNVTWPSTIGMNRRMCEVYGQEVPSRRELAEGLPAYTFPEPQKLARVRPASLRGRCRVGYRDVRIVELARMFSKGQIDEAWLADPATPADEVRRFLLTLPGIGPYAAANIMQLLGRYDHVALDTEALRHGKDDLGFRGKDGAIMKRVAAHYAAFGSHAFRSYWLTMWTGYEARRGPAWTWERESAGSALTTK
ncbi:MAG: DNA-3-methyladenine glycosylase family protein [Phycisphaerales bacterium JB039]